MNFDIKKRVFCSKLQPKITFEGDFFNFGQIRGEFFSVLEGGSLYPIVHSPLDIFSLIKSVICFCNGTGEDLFERR